MQAQRTDKGDRYGISVLAFTLVVSATGASWFCLFQSPKSPCVGQNTKVYHTDKIQLLLFTPTSSLHALLVPSQTSSDMVSTADLPLVTPAPDPAAVAQTPSLIPSLSALKDEALPETPTTPTTAARRKMKTLEDEELERQIEALAVPGYSIHQEGVFTVITRVEKSGRSRTFPARIAR